jgi:hypothetical protein
MDLLKQAACGSRRTHLQVIVLVLEYSGRPVGVCTMYLFTIDILRLDLDVDMPLRGARRKLSASDNPQCICSVHAMHTVQQQSHCWSIIVTRLNIR